MTAAPYRGVPDWTQGTATIANGSRSVTLTNSGIIATDSASGLDYSAVRSGDFFVVDGVGFGLITDVSGVSGASTATLTLAVNWTAAVQTAAAYRVVRMSMPSTGEVRALMQQLLARGGSDSPFTKFYTDDSTGRLVVDPHSGAPGLYVGQTGVSDAALKAALTADRATGVVAFPSGVAGWALTGARNRLRNASFAINQRGLSGTVTLAAGAYGHDGLKAGSAGATYTFATSGLDTTITLSAGSVIMPIEAGLIEGGSYVLSHEGAAQARIWQGSGYTGTGSYVTASRSTPLAVSGLAAGVQTNVEFSSGTTILRPQFEPGAFVQAFERRSSAVELEICKRYLQRLIGWSGGWQASTTLLSVAGRFSPAMMNPPSVIIKDGASAAAEFGLGLHDIMAFSGGSLAAEGGYIDWTTSVAGLHSFGSISSSGLILAATEF